MGQLILLVRAQILKRSLPRKINPGADLDRTAIRTRPQDCMCCEILRSLIPHAETDVPRNANLVPAQMQSLKAKAQSSCGPPEKGHAPKSDRRNICWSYPCRAAI